VPSRARSVQDQREHLSVGVLFAECHGEWNASHGISRREPIQLRGERVRLRKAFAREGAIERRLGAEFDRSPRADTLAQSLAERSRLERIHQARPRRFHRVRAINEQAVMTIRHRGRLADLPHG